MWEFNAWTENQLHVSHNHINIHFIHQLFVREGPSGHSSHNAPVSYILTLKWSCSVSRCVFPSIRHNKSPMGQWDRWNTSSYENMPVCMHTHKHTRTQNQGHKDCYYLTFTLNCHFLSHLQASCTTYPIHFPFLNKNTIFIRFINSVYFHTLSQPFSKL